jgi:hypothetical protein
MSTRTRLTRFADRCAGYLGLSLIGLIGWSCDRFGSSAPRERAASRADSGIRPVARLVD